MLSASREPWPPRTSVPDTTPKKEFDCLVPNQTPAQRLQQASGSLVGGGGSPGWRRRQTALLVSLLRLIATKTEDEQQSQQLIATMRRMDLEEKRRNKTGEGCRDYRSQESSGSRFDSGSF